MFVIIMLSSALAKIWPYALSLLKVPTLKTIYVSFVLLIHIKKV